MVRRELIGKRPFQHKPIIYVQSFLFLFNYECLNAFLEQEKNMLVGHIPSPR